MAKTTRPVAALKDASRVLALAGAVWAVSGWARAAQGEGAAPEIVARVNGEPVARAEWQRMVTAPLERRELLEELGAKAPDDRELSRLALQKLINRSLLVQEARRRSFVVTDQELDRAIAELRRRFGDLRSFGAWMQERGLDDRALFENVRTGILSARVAGALVARVRVTDEQVQRYYDAHQRDLKTEEVRLQIIAVGSRAAAEEILAALQKGEEFGGLARKRSIGIRAARGGDTGWIVSETLRSPVREVVRVLRAREFVGPVQRGAEFLIVRLHDRRPGRAKSLAEARAEIEGRLLAAEQQEALEAWLAEQQKKSKIEVYEG